MGSNVQNCRTWAGMSKIVCRMWTEMYRTVCRTWGEICYLAQWIVHCPCFCFVLCGGCLGAWGVFCIYSWYSYRETIWALVCSCLKASLCILFTYVAPCTQVIPFWFKNSGSPVKTCLLQCLLQVPNTDENRTAVDATLSACPIIWLSVVVSN